jgi:hypothetical protein
MARPRLVINWRAVELCLADWRSRIESSGGWRERALSMEKVAKAGGVSRMTLIRALERRRGDGVMSKDLEIFAQNARRKQRRAR